MLLQAAALVKVLDPRYPAVIVGRDAVFTMVREYVPGLRAAPRDLLLLNPSERGLPRMRGKAR